MTYVTPSRLAVAAFSAFFFGIMAGGFFDSHAQEGAALPPNGASINAVVPLTQYNSPEALARAQRWNPQSVDPQTLITAESSVVAMGVLGIAGIMWRRTDKPKG